MPKNVSSPKLTTTWVDNECVVCLEGAGSLEASQQLKAYLLKMIEKGCAHLAVDLRHCPYMNSVFVGTLLGISMRLQKKLHQKLTLMGLNATNQGILKMLNEAGYRRFTEAP